MWDLPSVVVKEAEAVKVMSAVETDGEMVGEGFVTDVAGEDGDAVNQAADALAAS